MRRVWGLLLVVGVWSFGFSVETVRAADESVLVRTSAELQQAVLEADRGGPKTIVVEKGTYILQKTIWVKADGVTVRGALGNRKNVHIYGLGPDGSVSDLFRVSGSDFTLRDMTIGRVRRHAVLIQGEKNADRPRIINVRLVDSGEQLLKVSWDPQNPGEYSDLGLVERCLFEYGAEQGPRAGIGGIEAQHAHNWIVARNRFYNAAAPEGRSARFAVHFHSGSQNTLVERNLIVNCDQGVGFGLGEGRHLGGVIRSNIIFNNGRNPMARAGVRLESASMARVCNNTVFLGQDYPNAIEYRFPATSGVRISNNLTNRAVVSLDGGRAILSGNLTRARAEWFRDPENGDLHLVRAVPVVVDRGVVVPNPGTDFDGEIRPAGKEMDIGADEWTR